MSEEKKELEVVEGPTGDVTIDAVTREHPEMLAHRAQVEAFKARFAQLPKPSRDELGSHMVKILAENYALLFCPHMPDAQADLAFFLMGNAFGVLVRNHAEVVISTLKANPASTFSADCKVDPDLEQNQFLAVAGAVVSVFVTGMNAAINGDSAVHAIQPEPGAAPIHQGHVTKGGSA